MDRMSGASEPEVQSIAERMQRLQPYIMVYLLAGEESHGQAEDAGWLLSLGGIIVEAMTAAHPCMRQVTGDDLLAAEQANVSLLEDLDAGSEFGFARMVEKLHSTYNQMPLLGVILNSLMAGYEDEPELAPNTVGLALLHLKTVIDCLDQ